jgi:hypothetical protein
MMECLRPGPATAFGVALIALLTNCGGTTPAFGAPAATTQSRTWMLPEAKGENLLYAATGADVYVLSYPGGKLVGELGVAGNNICADKHGDVFVPEGGYQVAEYAHGGNSPIQVLYDGDIPLGCAVDPKSGNLAVTNEGSGAGEVAIFPDAKGPSQWYRDSAIGTYGLCGYDDKGNLFLDGTSGDDGGGDVFAELPKGSSNFTNYTLDARFDPYGSVQWDGSYITLTNPSSHIVYRLAPSRRLKVAGASHIAQWVNKYSGGWPYIQTWIQGATFIAQSSASAYLGLWEYPAGGMPRKVIGGFAGGSVNVYGVAVSLAKH